VVRVSSLRASDADRELTAERLRHATVEGRLTPDELEDRIGVLYASKTYGELDGLLADLPVSRVPARQASSSRGLRPWLPVAAAVALFTMMLGALTDDGHGGGAADWHRGRFGAGGSFGGAHHLATQAASTALTLLALIAVAAALAWALVRRRDG
jgi:hypothetical protein